MSRKCCRMTGLGLCQYLGVVAIGANTVLAMEDLEILLGVESGK